MDRRKTTVRLADEKIRKTYKKLSTSNSEDKRLKKWIDRAMGDLAENAYCGIQIPKKLFPKEYIKQHGIDNLWKYNLPNAWRLIYTIRNKEVCIYSIILEWMPHKDYEKRFKY